MWHGGSAPAEAKPGVGAGRRRRRWRSRDSRSWRGRERDRAGLACAHSSFSPSPVRRTRAGLECLHVGTCAPALRHAQNSMSRMLRSARLRWLSQGIGARRGSLSASSSRARARSRGVSDFTGLAAPDSSHPDPSPAGPLPGEGTRYGRRRLLCLIRWSCAGDPLRLRNRRRGERALDRHSGRSAHR